ncbi:MAG: two-component sensor histidine kinase [Symbiobacteriaceae bacterium]|jgi:signal transduction histidine kinase|nr:two-component sensor histidine kinase [Symbiobacteriaceae bacterium]
MSRSLVVKFMVAITLIVVTVLAGALMWDIRYQQLQAENSLLVKADLLALETKAKRAFIAKTSDKIHGELSPSEVSSGVDALFADLTGVQVKQTNLNPRDEKNMPDDFEEQALIAFKADPDQHAFFTRAVSPDGQPTYRFITPLRIEESCLSCHGEPAGSVDRTGHIREGMKLGDLAGAISVTLPMADTLATARTETIRLAVGVLLVAVLVLALIWFMLQRQVSQPLGQLTAVSASIGGGHIKLKPEALKPLYANQETAVVADAFASMTQRLEESYSSLEQKVCERTAQLTKANADLERASRHQSEFLTMVSHEFRTPLTSIITFTELLLDDAAGHVNQEQKEYLTDVLESSQRLLQMINDLLDLSRLDAGKVKLFREVLDVRDLARDAERTVRPLAERKGLTLTMEVPAHLPLVEADPLRITQVLLNLLSNAIKFTPEGGRVTITARVTGEFLEVSVTDTGIGIGPEDRERVFEKFSQAGRDRPEGTGLGLPLARSLVELHGGQIWLESEPGRGSTFRFTLPSCSEEGRNRSHG